MSSILTKTDHINVDVLSGTIKTTLAEFADATAEAVENATDLTAAQTVDKLRSTSPRQPGGGSYAKSWTSEVWQKHLKGHYKRLISAKEYRLTHLLEYGHRIMRDGKEVGYADARPHIAQAEIAAINLFEANLRREIEK